MAPRLIELTLPTGEQTQEEQERLQRASAPTLRDLRIVEPALAEATSTHEAPTYPNEIGSLLKGP